MHNSDLSTYSRRMGAVQSPVVPVVADLIKATPGTISLGQGVVYYGPPETALQSVMAHGRELNQFYGPVEGIPELAGILTHKLSEENHISIDEQRRLVVTAGANMGFLNALFAITDPGAEVILPTPYYFNHEMAVRMLNCEPVCVATDQHFQLDPEAVAAAITPRTAAVVTISPNNPSGAVYPEKTLRTINEICRDRGIYHISDEAYEYFVFDDRRHYSPASLDDSTRHTISIVFLIQGIRVFILAHRLHAYPCTPSRSCEEGTGYQPDLPAVGFPVCGHRRAGSRQGILRREDQSDRPKPPGCAR